MISSFEVNSDGLRIRECGRVGTSQEEANTLLFPDICASVEMSLSDSVFRAGFDGEENRTRQRLPLEEGARNGSEGPEDPFSTSLRKGPAHCLPKDRDSQCRQPRGPWMTLPAWPSGMEETLDPEPQG